MTASSAADLPRALSNISVRALKVSMHSLRKSSRSWTRRWSAARCRSCSPSSSCKELKRGSAGSAVFSMVLSCVGTAGLDLQAYRGSAAISRRKGQPHLTAIGYGLRGYACVGKKRSWTRSNPVLKCGSCSRNWYCARHLANASPSWPLLMSDDSLAVSSTTADSAARVPCNFRSACAAAASIFRHAAFAASTLSASAPIASLKALCDFAICRVNASNSWTETGSFMTSSLCWCRRLSAVMNADQNRMGVAA